MEFVSFLIILLCLLGYYSVYLMPSLVFIIAVVVVAVITAIVTVVLLLLLCLLVLLLLLLHLSQYLILFLLLFLFFLIVVIDFQETMNSLLNHTKPGATQIQTFQQSTRTPFPLPNIKALFLITTVSKRANLMTYFQRKFTNSRF